MMNMKNITNIIVSLVCLFVLSACSKDIPANIPESDTNVNFTATLQQSNYVETRAIGTGEDGRILTLPYINKISVRKIQPGATPLTVYPYNVKTANKGVLEYQGVATNALKWDSAKLAEDVDFYAWTTPSGVTVNSTEGIVDFVPGNTFSSTADIEDQLNGQPVTPLEVFISGMSIANRYAVSPSVTLPFTHLVSKVSIQLRNWDAQLIKKANATGITLEFLYIPQQWKVKQSESGNKSAFLVTEPTGSAQTLKINFSDLYYDNSNDCFVLYMPPLIQQLGSDFTSAGDFCVTYGGKEYYGTLDNISAFKELKAGEHMSLSMDISKNYGVGIGAYIRDWQGPSDEKIAYSNPNNGIYSIEGLQILLDCMHDLTTLPDSLYVTEGSQKVVRLYRNLTIPETMLGFGTGADPFAGIIFDGQGYTITMPATSGSSLFGVVGSTSATTKIQNLYVKAGAVTTNGTSGIIANTVSNATFENCHILGGSITGGTDPVGGFIGSAIGSTIQFCSSTANVTGGGNAGGLVGTLQSSTITGCSAQGSVSGAINAGGLVGELVSGGSLTNSFYYPEVSVSGAGNCGQLVGKNGGIIKNCYWGISSSNQGDPIGTGTACITSNGFLTETIEVGETTYKTLTFGEFSGSPAIFNLISTYNNLIEALSAETGKEWVWVYGKDMPVVRIL